MNIKISKWLLEQINLSHLIDQPYIAYTASNSDFSFYNCEDESGGGSCTNCSYCTNYTKCSESSGCNQCSDCSNCSNCSDCSDYSDCSDCSNCSNCSNTVYYATVTVETHPASQIVDVGKPATFVY